MWHDNREDQRRRRYDRPQSTIHINKGGAPPTRMIALTFTKVKDEETLYTLLDSLERYHGVKALYQKPCLARTYHVVIEGPNEGQFESDLSSFASQVGWSVDRRGIPARSPKSKS
jgi:hypothetical protein